jgi:flagellar motor switch protein FliM
MPQEELLTTEEISALLPATPVDEAAVERGKRGRVIPYNFRRPDRLSKEHVRSLYMLHDHFANNLTSSLPLFLRTVSEVTLISVEQQSYTDYLKGLSDPTTIFTLAATSMRSVFVVEFSSSIAFPIIDRLLGGNGHELKETRPATELELKVLEGFLAVVVSNYAEVWKPHAELETEVIGRETRPQMLQVVPPNEVVATISYQIQIGDSKGSMSLCLPVALLEPVVDGFGRATYASDELMPPETTASLLRAIADVRFPVSCELEAVAVAVSDLNALAVGDVLRTNHLIDKTLNVCVSNSAKFVGRLASLDGKLIVQVTNASEPVVSKAAD